MGGTGLEETSIFSKDHAGAVLSAAAGAAITIESGFDALVDDELAAIVRDWPKLTAEQRQAIASTVDVMVNMLDENV